MRPVVESRRVEDQVELDRFAIFVGDRLAGHSDYRRSPGLIAFIHTEIEPEFEGQGLASKLIEEALQASSENDLEVLPFCPFVSSFIAEHPAYLGLVPENQRESFGL